MLAYKRHLLLNQPRFFTRVMQLRGDNQERMLALVSRIEDKLRLHPLYMNLPEYDMLEQSRQD